MFVKVLLERVRNVIERDVVVNQHGDVDHVHALSDTRKEKKTFV